LVSVLVIGRTLGGMLERFTGDGGSRLLADALSRQPLMHGAADIASTVAERSEVARVDAGSVLIEQASSDNDLYFILAGSFAILVNGREIARRRAEQHVGEMALIDPKARRSAAVIALEESVVARIPEPEFTAIADQNPKIWKNLACELGERLRQRNDLVRQRNEIPRVFIGSSKESLDIANAMQLGLARDPFIVTVWTNGVFGPSEFPIEALERAASESDFAILVLGPDDRVVSRKHENLAPRDNVILELGLFIGAAGRRRVFLLTPEGLDVKIPTDVLGVIPVRYSADVSLEPGLRLERACSEIRVAMSALGPR
jgi:predicted nucleotide-binding protein